MQILAIATAIAVVCALHPIPNQGARHCGDLFSVAVGSNLAPGYVFVDWRAQVVPDAH